MVYASGGPGGRSGAIGLNKDYEEYAVHNYELPVRVEEYISIEDLNRLSWLLEEIEGRIDGKDIQAVLDRWFSGLEELAEHVEDIHLYPDCSDMTELAFRVMNEGGFLDGVPDEMKIYFDYDSYGRKLEISGHYLLAGSGVYEWKA